VLVRGGGENREAMEGREGRVAREQVPCLPWRAILRPLCEDADVE